MTHLGRITLAACFMLCPALPVSAQQLTKQGTPCGSFMTARQMGETEFEFHYKNFQQCERVIPLGLTVVDAVATPANHDKNRGDSYTVTCDCKPPVCITGECGR